jgi:NADH-ubiquinone oxidoreductase chain 3
MTSMTFFFIFIPSLAIIFITVNFIFAPHNPYQEKLSSFECGFHSFLFQNRTQFNISFFVFGLLFLIFDLEILLVYPYVVSAYVNGIYGLIIMIIFFLALTLGFAFEIGKGALKIISKQNDISSIYNNNYNNNIISLIDISNNFSDTPINRPVKN